MVIAALGRWLFIRYYTTRLPYVSANCKKQMVIKYPGMSDLWSVEADMVIQNCMEYYGFHKSYDSESGQFHYRR